MSGFYEEIDGVKVHYERAGRGPKVLLLIPGLLCPAKEGFPDQLGGLDPDAFTLIGMDLPGWGRSRPPNRRHVPDIVHKDASIAANLMEKLGYKKYSVLGWSYGGLVSYTLAANAKSSTCIEKLIILAGLSHLCDRTFKLLTSAKSIEHLFADSTKILTDAYGKELAQQLFNDEVKFWLDLKEKGELNWDPRDEMINIKCPTLIVHGDKDELVKKEHALMGKERIPNSRLVCIPEGTHVLQQLMAKEFNKIICDFLLLD